MTKINRSGDTPDNIKYFLYFAEMIITGTFKRLAGYGHR